LPTPPAAAKIPAVASAEATIRLALEQDVPAIVGLFADDDAGRRNAAHGTLGPAQLEAFREIEPDPNNAVYVAELAGKVVGTFQLTFIRQLSNGGCLVAQVESVHVHSSARSHGIGAQMMAAAIAEARRRRALRIQLTSNLRRTRAHAFYERLGFEFSHKGMKLYLAY
jgi:GNAT superfamily N-acetyltransferase